MQNIDSQYLIEKLNLRKHPEGGYYKELFKSEEWLEKSALPKRYGGDRSFYTSIYFMLIHGQVSKFHRIKSDEIWHYYLGDPMEIYVIDEGGELVINKLGINLEQNEAPQILIKKDQWFAAKVLGSKYTLVGCAVSPGFEFEDFELAEREALLRNYPHLEKTIKRFT